MFFFNAFISAKPMMNFQLFSESSNLFPFLLKIANKIVLYCRIRVTRKEDLIGEWVTFTMDEWEELAADRPIRGLGAKPPMKTRVTGDFHVEVCCYVSGFVLT